VTIRSAPSESPLSGRVVLISGAARGLGQSHVELLLQLGAAVAAADVDGDALEQLAGAAPSSALLTLHGDVSSESGATAMVERSIDRFGRLDAVVNNAGFLRDASLPKMTLDRWREVTTVHLDGAYLLTRAAWPHLRQSGSGRVVFTTSHAGLVGNHGQSNYAAAKMGLVGLANVLAIEGARYGIGVNVVAPLAHTRLSDGVWPEGILERLDPRFVSILVARLCSSECGETGVVIGAGGGLYVRHAICDVGEARFARPPSWEELGDAWADLCIPPSNGTGVGTVRRMLEGEPGSG